MEVCRDKRDMDICLQQNEIKMRHIPAVYRFKRYLNLSTAHITIYWTPT